MLREAQYSRPFLELHPSDGEIKYSVDFEIRFKNETQVKEGIKLLQIFYNQSYLTNDEENLS